MAKPIKFTPTFSETDKVWILNIPEKLSGTGKRARQTFKNRVDAIQAAKKLKDEHRKFGERARAITPAIAEEVARAETLLRNTLQGAQDDLSLLSVVKDWVTKENARNASISLSELFNRFLATKKNMTNGHQARIRYLRDRFEKFEGGKVASKMICDIEASELEDAMADLADTSKPRAIRILRACFGYAVDKEWLARNPAKKMDLIEPKKKAITVFPNDIIERMLRYSLEKEIELVPYLALGAFAGIRLGETEAEMFDMVWTDIKFDRKEIIIRPEVSKTEDTRFIPIQPNLEAWLKVYLERTGIDPKVPRRIVPPYGTLRKIRWRVNQAVAADFEWIPAGLRKSFASACVNSGRLSLGDALEALGHGESPRMFRKHYHTRTELDDAKAYWQIMPPSNTEKGASK